MSTLTVVSAGAGSGKTYDLCEAIADRVARLIEPDPAAGEVTAGVLGAASRERADTYIAAIGGPLESDARRMLSDLSVSESPVIVVQAEEAVDGRHD